MSHLLGHARAAEIMAGAFADTAVTCVDASNQHTLTAIASALALAGERMRQAMRDDAQPNPEPRR